MTRRTQTQIEAPAFRHLYHRQSRTGFDDKVRFTMYFRAGPRQGDLDFIYLHQDQAGAMTCFSISKGLHKRLPEPLRQAGDNRVYGLEDGHHLAIWGFLWPLMASYCETQVSEQDWRLFSPMPQAAWWQPSTHLAFIGDLAERFPDEFRRCPKPKLLGVPQRSSALAEGQ